MTQVVTEGTSLQSDLLKRYGQRLTPIRGDAVKTAERSSFFFLGRVNSGKTYFLLSRSDLALVNLDLSPTTRPNAQALCWPALDMDPPITWKDVHDFIGKACLDPDINAVAIDSLGRAIGLARRHAAYTYYSRRCKRQNIPEKDIKSYHDFDHYDIRFQDGQTIWDLTYEAIVLEMARVQQAGKGFVLTGHLDLQQVATTDGGYEDKEVPVATAACLRRLLHAMDGVFVIRRQSETKIVAPKPGEVVTRRRATEKVTKQYMVTKGLPTGIQDYLIKARTRSLLPDRIDITEGWKQFSEAYNDAV